MAEEKTETRPTASDYADAESYFSQDCWDGAEPHVIAVSYLFEKLNARSSHAPSAPRCTCFIPVGYGNPTCPEHFAVSVPEGRTGKE